MSLDAVDVAFTEAAVGAGLSPLLMLATLTMLGQKPPSSIRYTRLALAIVSVTGVMLILGTLDMPAFGDPDAPAHQHVASRYIESSYEETGVPNIVTSVLSSYRGFDTLGEVAVVFTAGVGVLSLLMTGLTSSSAADRRESLGMQDNKILRIVGKVLIAPILIFALYVQFHGDYSPGGGFQAGVIFAAAFILYEMLFGVSVASRVVNMLAIRVLAACGVLVFGAVGLVSFFGGYNYLDYSVLAADPVQGQHYGILLIELGVGITVAATMVLIYLTFAQRVQEKPGDTPSERISPEKDGV